MLGRALKATAWQQRSTIQSKLGRAAYATTGTAGTARSPSNCRHLQAAESSRGVSEFGALRRDDRNQFPHICVDIDEVEAPIERDLAALHHVTGDPVGTGVGWV